MFYFNYLRQIKTNVYIDLQIFRFRISGLKIAQNQTFPVSDIFYSLLSTGWAYRAGDGIEKKKTDIFFLSLCIFMG